MPSTALTATPITGSVPVRLPSGQSAILGQIIPVATVDVGISIPAFGVLNGLTVSWSYDSGATPADVVGMLGFQLLSMGPTPQTMWPNSVPFYTPANFPGYFFPVWEIIANADPTAAANLAGGTLPVSAHYSFFNGYAGGTFDTDAAGNVVGRVIYNITTPLPYASQFRMNGVNAYVSITQIFANASVRYSATAMVPA